MSESLCVQRTSLGLKTLYNTALYKALYKQCRVFSVQSNFILYI